MVPAVMLSPKARKVVARRRGGPLTATTMLQLAVCRLASVAVHPTVVLPIGNWTGELQFTETGADPPAVVGVGIGTATGPPVVELASIRAGQTSESSGVGAGAGESPQPALISASSGSTATMCLRRTKRATGAPAEAERGTGPPRATA